MITREQIQNIITPLIDEEGLFIVEIAVSLSNHITIFIDSDEGVTIDQCIAVSRFIEQNLNRDEEDYELDVSSAGLDLPLKVTRQYIKNIGRMVDVVYKNGRKNSGKLVTANDTSFDIEVERNVVVEGKKRKQLVAEIENIKYSDIKSTKIVVSFR
ncbi:MAG: ribosome assembly cofactor RimP [Bacteroidales bacterium]|nr:MAG: ribosome assembly cofactor RimP [Bacteroidales bacterium]